MEFLQIAESLSGAGLATLLILILVGGWKQIWVFGYQLSECRQYLTSQLEDCRRERDEFKAITLRTLGVAEAGVSLAEQRGVKR